MFEDYVILIKRLEIDSASTTREKLWGYEHPPATINENNSSNVSANLCTKRKLIRK